MRQKGARVKLREFFEANVGKIVTSKQLRDAAGSGVSEWARRVRELRDDVGMQILTHNDRSSLKADEYLLESLDLRPVVARGISARLRAQVLDRNGFTCQMCGASPGDVDASTNRKVRLHIGHIKDKSLGGKDELANLRALCSTCNQGAKNVTPEKPGSIWLLAQVRRAGPDEQKAVFAWLRKKLEG